MPTPITWPEDCEEAHCDHNATVRISDSAGNGRCLCICHAADDVSRLFAAYGRRLQLETDGVHPKLAMARAFNEFHEEP